MILLKSFFRKKTTKIYIIVFIILALSLVISNSLKNYFIQFANSNYEGSFIYTESNDYNLDNLKSIKNIKQIYKSAILNINNIMVLFTNPDFINYKESLAENLILIPQIYQNDYKIGDNFNININDINLDLKVKGYFNSNNYPFIYIINSKLIDEMIINNMGINAYAIKLNNWIDRDDTLNKIRETLKVENISTHIVNHHQMNFDFLIKVFNIILNMIIASFIIISIITLFNICNDERKKHMIYKSMGYSNQQLTILMITKITIIICIMLLATLLGFLIIKYI